MLARANESKLMTRLEKRNITLKNSEKLSEDVISRKINKKKPKNISNNIAEDVNKLNKLKPTESRKKMLPIFKQLEEIVLGSKADEEVDNEVDDETKDDESEDDNDEEIDTTDKPDVETEESVEQRRNQEGQGLKILTPKPMLSIISISLAQLKSGNNSEDLKMK